VSRLPALLIVCALWVALYLPGLGAIELKGEEGRRVLPAVTMRESGDWIVPYVGGRPYLRKPPLIHWLIAGAFRLTGHQDEWAARLPSALSVLALGAVIVLVGSTWLTPSGALVAAICALTNLGMLEKGRLAELEPLYIATFGIALICWLAWWREERSPWLVWLVPAVFLGLGLLTKGPLHLLFFYAVVVAVLWRAKRLRELLQPAHFLGVILMLGIFALWAVPYFREVAQLHAANVWTEEFAGRVARSKFKLKDWLENLWNNFENFLPWLLFTPLWWNRRILAALEPRDAAVFLGTRLATVICGCGLILIPGVVSRYTLPLVVPASLLVALALRTRELLPERVLAVWRGVLLIPFALAAEKRRQLFTPASLAIVTALITALGVAAFVVFKVPRVIAAETARPLGRRINAALPDVRELYVIDPGYQPALFYVAMPCRYVSSPQQLPTDATAVFLRSDAAQKLAKLGRTSRVLERIPERGGKDLLLLALDPPP
jgi:4-amino-4-deoxy-L-arabinose transferase-like glycosyltransferase